DVVTALAAQIEPLNKKIDGINVGQVIMYEFCGVSGHKSIDCQVGTLLLNLWNKWIMQGTFKDHLKITHTPTPITLDGEIILLFLSPTNKTKDHFHQDIISLKHNKN